MLTVFDWDYLFFLYSNILYSVKIVFFECKRVETNFFQITSKIINKYDKSISSLYMSNF